MSMPHDFIKKLYFFTILVTALLCSSCANAFVCSTNLNKVTVDIPPTILYVDIAPVALDKSTTDILLTDMKTYALCDGFADSYYQNALRATSLTLSTALTSLGYSGYLVSGSITSGVPPEVCLWPDSNCSINNTGQAPIDAQIRLQRTQYAGNWHAGGVIPAGTEIARMETQARDVGTKYISSPWHPVTWIFRLKTAMTIPAYTCAIVQSDKRVTLPDVSRTEIKRNGVGRYLNSHKDFNLELTCDPQTAVSVTFEGTPLNGSEMVLKNSLSGNDNIGVMMTFSDDSQIKLGQNYPVTKNAGATELLQLKAWYYYVGGEVSAGAIKSNATFTFDYQ